ncbi:MAG: oxygenase MpaB family protein [Mycobacterium sp.]
MVNLVQRDVSTARAQVAPRSFGPGDLLWDLAGEFRSNLIFLMPTLIQTMHPIIGDALMRRPVATTDPLGRLQRSVDSIHLWVYGGEAAHAERRRLIALHSTIKGRDIDGREHSALKPEVWAWVPLSAYPAFLTQTRVFGEPLSASDVERLYDEVKNLARILGVREQHIPATTEDYWAYYQQMVDERLINHPYVHDVLRAGQRFPTPPGLPRFLYRLWKNPIGPRLGAASVWLVHGTFPPEMRRILEIPWSARDERKFLLAGQLIRRISRFVPERWRYPTTPRLARAIARAEATGQSTIELQAALDRQLALIDSRNTKVLPEERAS